eukprot:5819971-Pyramimonas_sp.AAC.1
MDASHSVSCGGPSREDDDSAEARFEEADEGEELDSQRIAHHVSFGGGVGAGATGGVWHRWDVVSSVLRELFRVEYGKYHTTLSGAESCC